MGVTPNPSKNDPPLIVDSDRMEALPTTFELLKPVAGRHRHIPQLRCVVKVEQLSPGCSTKFRRKGPRCPRVLVVEQILRQCIIEARNHIVILPEDRNNNNPPPFVIEAAPKGRW